MSDEQSPNPNTGGQTDAAPWAQGQADSAPQSQGGQATAPESQDQGQAPSTPATDEPSFFDVNQVPAELLPAYKQMQAAFTVKTQGIARERQKVEAYDAFMRDPVGQIQQLARQYGYNLTRGQAEQMQQQAQQQQDWQPQTWDEVMQQAEIRAEQRIMTKLAPMLERMDADNLKTRAESAEQKLSQIDPNWREYEGNMRELLQKHPSMANDVSLLYRSAVPPEVLEGKAIQSALKKYEDKAQHQKVAQGGPAPRSEPAPPQINSFNDAVNAAKQQLNSGER